MDLAEQGSQHSASFGSDNTDALLNASLQDFDGEESVLGNASVVGDNLGAAYKSPNRTSHSLGKRQKLGMFSGLGTNGEALHDEISDVSSVQNGMFDHFSTNENRSNCSSNRVPNHRSIECPQRFEYNKNLDQGFCSMGEKLHVVNKDSYVQSKFSSDSDPAVSGRESVIKQHKSSLNVDSQSAKRTNKMEENQSYEVNRYGYTNQYLPNSHFDGIPSGKQKVKLATEDEYLSFSRQSGSIRDNGPLRPISRKLFNNDSQISDSQRQRNIGDVYSNGGMTRADNSNSGYKYGRSLDPNMKEFYDGDGALWDIGGKMELDYNGHPSDSISGEFVSQTSGGDVRSREPYYDDNGPDNTTERNHSDKMLLGVKHDPETNGKFFFALDLSSTAM